jgi:hypothetical protein
VGHFEGQTQIGGHFLFLFSGLYLFILVCLASYLSATINPKRSSVASFFPLGKKFHLASILSLQQPPYQIVPQPSPKPPLSQQQQQQKKKKKKKKNWSSNKPKPGNVLVLDC